MQQQINSEAEASWTISSIYTFSLPCDCTSESFEVLIDLSRFLFSLPIISLASERPISQSSRVEVTHRHILRLWKDGVTSSSFSVKLEHFQFVSSPQCLQGSVFSKSWYGWIEQGHHSLWFRDVLDADLLDKVILNAFTLRNMYPESTAAL